jgi:hypothetical protein
VSINLDTRSNTLRFGAVGSGGGRWPFFTRRFGKVVWRVDAPGDALEEEADALASNLQNGRAEVVLFEKGRVRPNSPVWKEDGVKVVVALEPWNPGTLEPWNPGTLEPWNPGEGRRRMAGGSSLAVTDTNKSLAA